VEAFDRDDLARRTNLCGAPWRLEDHGQEAGNPVIEENTERSAVKQRPSPSWPVKLVREVEDVGQRDVDNPARREFWFLARGTLFFFFGL